MARPKLSEFDLKQVENLAAQGLSDVQIADALGVSAGTLLRRKKDTDGFEEAIKKGRARGIAFVSNALFEQVKGGNKTAIIFFLKTRAGWREGVELAVGAAPASVVIQIPDNGRG